MEDREYKKVIDYVKEEIKRGNLAVSDRLPTERALAEKLSMSRGSVREALRTMGNIGILESKQGSGNYLKSDLNKMFTESIGMMALLNQISEEEIRSFRKAVEVEAYRLAVRNITPKQVEKLTELFEGMMNTEDNEQIEKDKEFHCLIISASKNKLFISIAEALDDIYATSVERSLIGAGLKEKARIAENHRGMLRGLAEKDEEFGMKALEAHYGSLKKE